MDSYLSDSLSSGYRISALEGSTFSDAKLEQDEMKSTKGSNQRVNELYRAKEKMRQFSMIIGNEGNRAIRGDVIRHCNKNPIKWEENMGYHQVEKMMKNRIQKMIKNKRIKKNWSEDDIKIFIWTISAYCDYKAIQNVEKDLTQEDWQQIAALIPGVSPETCLFKWLGMQKINLSDFNWSQRESGLLQKIVKKCGDQDWALIAQKLYYSNYSPNKTYRSPKQCREHWSCYLNPKIRKGPWSKQEDTLLLSNIIKNNGQKKWAQIVKHFNGRTQNALKNRYTLIIDKQLKMLRETKGDDSIQQMDAIKEYLQRIYIEQFMEVKNEDAGQPNKRRRKTIKSNKNKKSQEKPAQQKVRTSLRQKTSARSFTKKHRNNQVAIDYNSLMNISFGGQPKDYDVCENSKYHQKFSNGGNHLFENIGKHQARSQTKMGKEICEEHQNQCQMIHNHCQSPFQPLQDFPNYEESEKGIFNLQFGSFHGYEDEILHQDSNQLGSYQHIRAYERLQSPQRYQLSWGSQKNEEDGLRPDGDNYYEECLGLRCRKTSIELDSPKEIKKSRSFN